MDGWCFTDGGGAWCSTRTLDSFGGSFCSTSSEYVDVLDSANIGVWSYFGSSDSDPLSYSDAPPIHEHIYQSATLMEFRGEVFEFEMASRSKSVTTDDQGLLHQALLQQSQMVELFPESPPLPPQIQVAPPPPHAAVAPASQHRGAQFPSPDSDEAAVMRAMMAVLSSAASSSSSASSPSVMSNPPQELSIARHPQANANALARAFRPYTSGLLAPEPEPHANACGGGQRMIKTLILMARIGSTNGGGAEGEGPTDRATSNQRHHTISERRRREKLNDSFHTLRMILPPTPKKDKASVLINTRNYLKTLRAQITELEEKNRRLETHVHEEEAREGSGSGSSGSVQVQVIKACESTSSELQQITMRITVRVECDIVDLVLNVLECLKGMKAVSVASVDAYAYSPQIHLFARANLKFQIKRCDWNEASFHEAMNKAVDSVVSSTESIFQA